MPSSDKDGYPDGCFLCEGPAGTLHHVSYVPEKVILVCSRCHSKIHSERYYSGDLIHTELLPDMDRSSWEENHMDGYIERPEPHQLDWDGENIAEVCR